MSSEKDVNGHKPGSDGHNGRGIQVFEPDTVEISVARGPISGVAISPDGSRLLVANYGDHSVSVISTDTCRVMHTITGLGEPFAIAMGGAHADRAYVSTVSPAYDSIGVIDISTNTVVASHPVALSVTDLTVSLDGKYVYASRIGVRGADVAVLDTATDRVEVVDIAQAPGITPTCVRVSSDGSRLYVGANGPSGGRVVVIATCPQTRSRWRRKGSPSRGTKARTGPRVLAAIDIGAAVRDIALSPDGAIAYVASCGADLGAVVDVIDTRTNKITDTRKIGEIGGLVTRLTVSGHTERAYLVSEDRVTVLGTQTPDVIGTIRTNQPSCVVESPDGSYLYIADLTGTVTRTSVVSSPASDAQALQRAGSVGWSMPEPLQYEPALA
ncbi:hypothetical protein BST45_17825 [Mycobacterium shinjukuense]|uniref:Uncharacterized protein n=1 Tax=Mycobacterium shinjukuense TaxID=398694 RepID=A0A7I7MJN0_9MYCO|nr:hypothetical protein BST45_17825 [Mycobacterium shinjukuense]BBX72356.1 hypothetical protein MSHI_02620 [Mycobacterium shinjukuense]